MCRKSIPFLIAAALGLWLAADGLVFAGDKMPDIKGITVQANNYNSALIRREQSRRKRDINEVNPIPPYLYDTRPMRLR
ncbi:MAG: hypothetical protein LUC93_18490 [Planctomycetaceae bacterium]|nr:hypothetical protein [Planctomycetaceae bacterium]